MVKVRLKINRAGSNLKLLPFPNLEGNEALRGEEFTIGVDEMLGMVALWIRPNILVHVHRIEQWENLDSGWKLKFLIVNELNSAHHRVFGDEVTGQGRAFV